jgi:hypothetical protein
VSAGLIGLLGATGRVGTAAARALAPGHPLRLGGRREGALRALAGELGPAVGVRVLDLDDDGALDAFCAGTRVVLHCAAPAFGIGDRVARAAARAGAGYVDVSGDALLHRQLQDGPAPRVGVLGAGVIPGLSALLPRWLAGRTGGITRLVGYAGGVEPCSPGVARDMLLSLSTGGPEGAGFGEPLAAWRGGRRVSRALRAEEDATAPLFPGRVALQPFLAAEAERLARAEGIDTLEWCNVHPGPAVRATMRRLPALDPERAVTELVRAADLDLAGRTPYHLLVLVADDPDGGRHTAVLRSPDSYALTGVVAALATAAAAAGRVGPGVHYACDALDPAEVLDGVQRAGTSRLEVLDHDGSLVEEGAL